MILPSSRWIARANWPSRIFGPCANDGDILHAQRRAGLGNNHCVFDIPDVPYQAYFADIDLLEACFDEASARIRIVVGELLLHLGEAQSVGNQFIGVNANLIFAGGAAKARNINNIGNSFEVFLDHPVFDRFQSITSYWGFVLRSVKK